MSGMEGSTPSHGSYYENSADYAAMLREQRDDEFDLYVSLFTDSAAPGARVLDVGCGVGTSTYRLRDAGFDAIGSDIGQGLPDEPGFLHVDFQRAAAVADGSYDAVGAMNVLEHIERPREFLAEMVRVCGSGGKVILISPNLTSPLVPLRVLLDLRASRTPYLGIDGYRGALSLLAANLRRSIGAALGRDAFARRADTIDSGIVGYDVDAVYWTNAAEVSRHLRAMGCVIERYQGVGNGRVSRFLAEHVPSFAGQLLVVARRP
jgi:SAM-dependent methyltransferase